MFTVTATDTAGNITTKDVAYMVNSVDVPVTVAGGTVDTALGLSLPTTATTFGAVHAGRRQEYLTTAAPRSSRRPPATRR